VLAFEGVLAQRTSAASPGVVSGNSAGTAGLPGKLVRPVSALTLAVGLVVVVVGFGAWWTYFTFAGGRQPRPEPAASLQWILGHLPLTAAIAAMGVAMVSLIDHAHEGRAPAATAWVLGAGAAVMLGATVLIPSSLPGWQRDRGLYQPLSRTCAEAAVACLGAGALRPAHPPSDPGPRATHARGSPGRWMCAGSDFLTRIRAVRT